MRGKAVLITICVLLFLASLGIGATLLVRQNRRQSFLNSYQEAKALFDGGQYREALSLFVNIYPLSRGEQKIDITYKMGSCYQKLGATEEAYQYWDKVLNSPYTSYYPLAYFEIAQQKIREEKLEEAIIYYSKIIDEFPTHPLAEEAQLGLVDIYRAKGEHQKAKDYCERILSESGSLGLKEQIIRKLGDINMELLFSPVTTEISEVYSVKAGDTLSAIARRFNTTVPLLMAANHLNSTLIRPGKRLKVTPGKFSIVIDIKNNTLSLNYDGKIFKVYTIASGANKSTPLGSFKIVDKIPNPVWYSSKGVIPTDSPENILGSRWIGLSISGYGIHEAIDLSDLGKYVSRGCIRMKKEDLEELYDIITIGTPVEIVESSSYVASGE